MYLCIDILTDEILFSSRDEKKCKDFASKYNNVFIIYVCM